MNNNVTYAGTEVDSSTKDELLPSAPLAENPVLAAGCYPKSLSKGIVRMIAVCEVNGYEIINEFIPDDLPGRYNQWYLMEGGKQVSIKKDGKFSHYPSFNSKSDAEIFARSLSACR